MPNEYGLQQFRNHVTHWRLTGSAYFITWRLAAQQPDLSPHERTLVADAVKYFHGTRYVLSIYVVMNDHVHVIARPLGDEDLSKIIHSWKSFTANRMQRVHGRVGSVWQKDHFEHVIRNESDLNQKAQYIVNNPLKRWPNSGEYHWLQWF